jgi:arylsulfatase A-like enzyme
MIVFMLSIACSNEPQIIPLDPVVQSESNNNNAKHNGNHHSGKHPPHVHQNKSFHAPVNYSWNGVVSQSPRSIVLISLDTLYAGRMEIYGGRAKMSNLQSFADKATVFEQAFSHFPETALSHWTMMTSVLPEVHGNVPANGGSLYMGPTLAEIAKFHNYSTAAFIGGVTMTDQASGFGRGFDVYDDQFPFTMEDMSRDGRKVTAKARKWITEQNGPYFAFLHYFDSHFPYTPSSPWDTAYDSTYTGSLNGSDAVLRPYRDGKKKPSDRDVEHILALYDGEISELDDKLKGILSILDENTIVIITSDHGESFSHGYYFNHRAGLWDEITHVPLIIRAPGLPSGEKVSSQVGLIDLLPTVLELAGLPSDERMQGKSLVALANGQQQGREKVFSITDPWMPNPQFAVRTEEWKWISQQNSDLIYNLAKDPLEKVNASIVPSALSDTKKEYENLILSLQGHKAEVKQRRKISDEECKRLMALGYTTCDSQPQLPE